MYIYIYIKCNNFLAKRIIIESIQNYKDEIDYKEMSIQKQSKEIESMTLEVID